MSTPMYDLPEHLWMGVNRDGEGPVSEREPDFWDYVCWCGEPGCTKPEKAKPELPAEALARRAETRVALAHALKDDEPDSFDPTETTWDEWFLEYADNIMAKFNVTLRKS